MYISKYSSVGVRPMSYQASGVFLKDDRKTEVEDVGLLVTRHKVLI